MSQKNKPSATAPDTKKIIVHFYAGSYQFDSRTFETNRGIPIDYITLTLSKQHRYRSATDTLWCEVQMNGGNVRFQYDAEMDEVLLYMIYKLPFNDKI